MSEKGGKLHLSIVRANRFNAPYQYREYGVSGKTSQKNEPNQPQRSRKIPGSNPGTLAKKTIMR